MQDVCRINSQVVNMIICVENLCLLHLKGQKKQWSRVKGHNTNECLIYYIVLFIFFWVRLWHWLFESHVSSGHNTLWMWWYFHDKMIFLSKALGAQCCATTSRGGQQSPSEELRAYRVLGVIDKVSLLSQVLQPVATFCVHFNVVSFEITMANLSSREWGKTQTVIDQI